MKLPEFLETKLTGRGAQSRLAAKLRVSKSTVTNWRQGVKPSFAACLQLSDHFDLPPDRLFAMVGDAQYVKLYRRFFPEGPPDAALSVKDSAHREIHRKLQVILESRSKDAEMVVSVIAMASRQIETRDFLEKVREKAVDMTDDAIGDAFRVMMKNQKHLEREKSRGAVNQSPKRRRR